MKGFIFGRVIFMLTIALTFVPFDLWAGEKKPTYEELEQRVNELEQADAGESPSASADIGMFSKYVWRGWELSEDSLIIQPSATVEYKGFSMNLWGNLDTDNQVTEESDFNETDLTVAYDTSVGPVSVGVGYIYYALDGADTQEFYLSLGADCLLAPSFTVYRDIEELKGWYMNLGISHSIALPHEMSLDLGGSVGYYYSKDDDFVEVNSNGKRYRGLHDGLVSVGLTIPLDEYFTLTPMIAYSFPLGGNADDQLTADNINDSDVIFGGVTLSMAF